MTPADEVSLPPIGRLDEDSRGLLLLSSDGVVAKAVIGPESDLDKEYLVRVTGDIIALSPPLILEKSHIDEIFGKLAGLIAAVD